MQDFIPGQRWISDTELQMGLGTVLASDQRSVTILFPATGETRLYAKQTAPLTRVMFAPGDSVRSHEGWSLKVETVSTQAGLLTYHGLIEGSAPAPTRAQIAEAELDNSIQLSRPTERLFSGQIDHDKWFELRYQTLQHANRLAHSDLYGLTGSRTSLIPHQLYLAHEVANRYAPRVLLADEVGLGKTIEAGLILHQQLLTERARRVLIVVPESLLHQWLVEMLRRFNRHFSIFDEARCQATATDTGDNPFHGEQLILCSLEFLAAHPEHAIQARQAEWDLLVVDEAHHLQWSPERVSDEYALIEGLAAVTRGVLLLTATPEQLGKAGHFARLRLLDPDRFPDYDTFVAEERAYAPIAQAVEALLEARPLDRETRHTLLGTLAETDNRHLFDTLQDREASAAEKAAARNTLIDNLLDRHGTGRVLFRNTRAAVSGFPQRRVTPYPLPRPADYAALAEGGNDPASLLHPELAYTAAGGDGAPPWTQIDPRCDWLAATLRSLRPQKVLVITASARTALDLARTLKDRTGLHAAVFHDGLSLIERDRAAAYFADPDAGTQVLICSEIGSEGRNFQFAHHLVLFDLPLNPDLLEQRIGRLDRIGQAETIHLHVPYLTGSAQEVMYRWYQQGLSAFEHTCPAGHSVFVQVQEALAETLRREGKDHSGFDALIATTRRLHAELNAALHRGRDRLLEYNSCRPAIANDLKARAETEDTDTQLPGYLDAIFDCFGVDTDIHSDKSLVLQPGNHMQAPLPGLGDDGMTITYDRATALANENLQFLTWEHPLTGGAMDGVLSSELGNTALTALPCPGVAPGTLLLECLYVLESASSEALQASRYLPPTTIRRVTDQAGKDHSAALSHRAISRSRTTVDAETARNVVRTQARTLRAMAAASEKQAQTQAPQIVAAALEKSRLTLEREIRRLQALRQVNPNVRDEELDFFETQWRALTAVLESANLRLDAIRVIVAT